MKRRGKQSLDQSIEPIITELREHEYISAANAGTFNPRGRSKSREAGSLELRVRTGDMIDCWGFAETGKVPIHIRTAPGYGAIVEEYIRAYR